MLTTALVLLFAGCDPAKIPLGETGDTPIEGDTDTDADSDTDTDSDTDADTDADSDTDTDTDTDTDVDTGYAYLYFAGEFEASGDEYASGSFGWGYWGLIQEDTVCSAYGSMENARETEHECPGCDWSFTLDGPNDMADDGAYCDGFRYSMTYYEDALDGTEWGFAEEYAFPYYGSYVYLDETVFLYQSGYGFVPIAYNYNGSGRVGTEEDTVSFYGWSSNEYYYYYL